MSNMKANAGVMPTWRILWMLLTGNWGIQQSRSKLLPLPKSVAGFDLVQEVVWGHGHNDCQFGLYKDASGREAVAKQWSNTQLNERFYWIVNEHNVYLYLESLRKQFGKQIAEKAPDIVVPRLYHFEQGENRALILVERLHGEILVGLPFSERIAHFEKALDFMDLLASLDTPKDTNLLYRSRFFFLFQFILLGIVAMVRNFKYFPEILRAYIKGLANFPAFWRTFKPRFVHRDITISNVLKMGNGKVGILDFQLSVITDQIFELSQMLSGSSNNPEFRKEYYKHPRLQEIFSNPEKFSSFLFASLYISIHLLATCGQNVIEKNMAYLRESLDLRPTL